jgi:hypothetical protein
MGALDGTPFSKLFEQAQKSNNLDEKASLILPALAVGLKKTS